MDLLSQDIVGAKSWLEVRDRMHSNAKGWWVISRRGTTRFIIPTDPVAWGAAGQFIHGRKQKLALTAALRFRALIRKPCDFEQPASTSRFDDWLEGGFSEPVQHKAVYIGTPSIFAKDTIQCQSCTGEILAYAKIAKTKRAKESIATEVKTLEMLRAELPQETFFPHILKKGTEISLQSAGPESSGNTSIKDVRDILYLLANQTREEFSWPKSPSACIIAEAISSLAGRGMAKWAETLQSQFDILHQTFGTMSLPHSLCHGDFVPWNLRGRFAFDWEWAGIDLPWQDFLHYSLFPLLTQAKAPTDQSLQRHLKKAIRRMELSQYDAFSSFGPQWTRVYLAKKFAFYSKSAIDNGDDPRNFRFLHNFHSLLHR